MKAELAEELEFFETMRATIERQYLTDVVIPEGIQIILTCESCPEQYEVRRDGREIGYIRFRHAKLRVEYPTCGGERLFYEEWPILRKGDEHRSKWDTQDQRAHDLTRFIEMLVKRDDAAQKDNLP